MPAPCIRPLPSPGTCKQRNKATETDSRRDADERGGICAPRRRFENGQRAPRNAKIAGGRGGRVSGWGACLRDYFSLIRPTASEKQRGRARSKIDPAISGRHRRETNREKFDERAQRPRYLAKPPRGGGRVGGATGGYGRRERI